MWLRGWVAGVWVGVLAMLTPACSGCGQPNELDAGVDASRDAPTDVPADGPTDADHDAPTLDVPTLDVPTLDAPDVALPDAPGSCMPACVGLSRCIAEVCVDYPPCGPGASCATVGDICLLGRCVPSTDDPDGDRSPAAVDCDELDARRFPGNTEVCNDVDDDCNGAPDDGDAGALCVSDPMGGLCMGGVCSCPAGFADLDRAMPGCECPITPAIGGETCESAIDLGSLSDAAMVLTISGNALPTGRDVWYRVDAIDLADAICDNFHFRVLLAVNPDDAFEMSVVRGPCGSAFECAAEVTGRPTFVARSSAAGSAVSVRAPPAPARPRRAWTTPARTASVSGAAPARRRRAPSTRSSSRTATTTHPDRLATRRFALRGRRGSRRRRSRSSRRCRTRTAARPRRCCRRPGR